MDGFICIPTCHLGCIYPVGRLEMSLGSGVGLDPPPGMGLLGGSGCGREQGEKVLHPSQIHILHLQSPMALTFSYPWRDEAWLLVRSLFKHSASVIFRPRQRGIGVYGEQL